MTHVITLVTKHNKKLLNARFLSLHVTGKGHLTCMHACVSLWDLSRFHVHTRTCRSSEPRLLLMFFSRNFRISAALRRHFARVVQLFGRPIFVQQSRIKCPSFMSAWHMRVSCDLAPSTRHSRQLHQTCCINVRAPAAGARPLEIRTSSVFHSRRFFSRSAFITKCVPRSCLRARSRPCQQSSLSKRFCRSLSEARSNSSTSDCMAPLRSNRINSSKKAAGRHRSFEPRHAAIACQARSPCLT